ncbi:hypothetical protein RRG08_062999, partial [Elysia crispata]
MTTRQRPPKGRLRLSPTPPLENGGTHVPPTEMATTSRPDQITRLAGRERKTTSIRTIQDMTSIETITRHSDLASEASPERDTAVPQNRAPGIRTLVFERSPESVATLDPATPAFVPGVPYRQAFQEAAPESRVRGHVTYADAARSPPLNIYMPDPSITPPRLSPSQKTGDNRPAPTSTAVAGQTLEGTGAGHAEFNRPTPELLPSSRSPQQHASESRPTPTTSIEAGRQLEGTGVDQDELKLRGAMQGEKILFPLPIPGTITCDLCRPPVSWRRKKSNHRDALRHMQELHDARTVAAFRCTRCGYATTTLHAGNRHLSRSCTGVRALEEAPQEDTDNDDGGIPQPGWQDRMPEVTPPRASGDTRVSRVNQEGDSPEAGEDSLAVDTHDDEETVTRAAFSA